MRNERKYVVLTIFSLLMVGLLLVNCGREFWRMEHALKQQDYEYVALGAKLYAQNCIQCHGPRGEGVVGLPLNRPDLQGSPHETKYKDVYRMLVETLNNGRLGRATPHWVQAPDGKWISYTAMPAWGRNAGGPMDEHMIKALAYFIMLGNQPIDGEQGNNTYWSQIGGTEFPPQDSNNDAALPDPNPNYNKLTAEQVAQAKDIIENKLKPSCLSCHAIGSRGAKIGPDLTAVGGWVDENQRDEWEAFLKAWIYDAPAMPAEQRMPNYWFAHRSPGPDVVFDDPVPPDAELNKTFMPSFKKYFDENPGDLDLVVRYLMGLVPAK